jgi:hypothetical protein
MLFRVDWVPPSNNRSLRMHWTSRRQVSDVVGRLIVAAAGKPRDRESGRVRITITMYRHRLMDRDNAYGAAKPLFDALVRLGYAVDDSPRWMQQQVRTFVIDHRAIPRTEIEITRLGKGAAQGSENATAVEERGKGRGKQNAKQPRKPQERKRKKNLLNSSRRPGLAENSTTRHYSTGLSRTHHRSPLVEKTVGNLSIG